MKVARRALAAALSLGLVWAPSAWAGRPTTCKLIAGRIANESPEAQAVVTPLVALEALLTGGTSTADLPDALVAKSAARIQVMRVQKLRELYSSELGKKFDTQLDKIDKLSKQLGAYGDAIQFNDFAQACLTRAFAGQGPISASDAKAVMREFQKRRAAARDAFESFLEDGDWADDADGPLSKVADKLQSPDWLSAKKTVKATRKQLANMLDEILAKKYDFNDLENGTHALRKDLRSFMIAIQATYGIVRLTLGGQTLPPELAALVGAKYAQMNPVSVVDNPLTLSLYDYMFIVQDEQQLGAAKDVGQGTEALADVLAATGVASKKMAPGIAEQIAADAAEYRDHPELHNLPQMTRDVYRAVMPALRRMRAAMDKG